MTTNKSEVKRFNILTYQGAIQSKGAMCVLASDYDALQAECEKLRNLLIEIERGCSRRDMPSEQTISSWADAIDAAIQGDQP